MKKDNFKYKDIPWEKEDPKEIIFELIENNSKVLDLGCWAGRFGEKLKNEKNCLVYGTDINKQAIKLAEKRLDLAFLSDLSKPETLKETLREENFDFITAIEVLEHLAEPEELLLEIKKYLGKNGKLIVSVPNVANYAVRLNLLAGNFSYEDQGILDETHLRFFTLFTIKKLINDSGYKIEQIKYTRAKIFPTFFATQFILVCRK